MKMLEVAEYSPSFARMSPAVIEYAVKHGAAKVDNLLSESSHDALMDEDVNHDPGKLAELAPELGYYFSLLGVEPDDDRLIGNSYNVYPSTTQAPDIHRNSNIEFGIRLILPQENSAIFGVDNRRFQADEMPRRVWGYGPRDGMVLRQGLRTYNGRRVRMQRAWHAGYRTEVSAIFALDLHTEDLSVCTNTSASTTKTN